MTGPIASPCRNVCRLGGDGVCDGCGRRIEEIGSWLSMTVAERARIIERLAGWSIRGPTSSSEDSLSKGGH